MSDPFKLEESRWWNATKVNLACKASRTSAEQIIKHAKVLGNFEYEPVTGSELATAETMLTEALLGLQLARREYERNTLKPHMEAAE